jgi:transposase-like protein
MSENVRELRPKQEAAIVALLSNRSVDEAARSVDVAPKTLYRWLKEPAFDKAYRKARRDAFGQTIARLQQGSRAAASVLLNIVADSATPASTRVRAAEIVLDKAAKAIELEDVEVHVSELERAAEATRQGR